MLWYNLQLCVIFIRTCRIFFKRKCTFWYFMKTLFKHLNVKSKNIQNLKKMVYIYIYIYIYMCSSKREVVYNLFAIRKEVRNPYQGISRLVTPPSDNFWWFEGGRQAQFFRKKNNWNLFPHLFCIANKKNLKISVYFNSNNIFNLLKIDTTFNI